MNKDDVEKTVALTIELGGILGLTGIGMYLASKLHESECRCEKLKFCAEASNMIAESTLNVLERVTKENEQLKAELEKKEEVQTKAGQTVEEA